MSTESVKLDVTSSAALAGLKHTQDSLSALEKQVNSLTTENAELAKSLEDVAASAKNTSSSGKGMEQMLMEMVLKLGGAAAGVAAVLAGIKALAGGYVDLVSEGVKYNASLGDAELAIGKVIQKFDGLDEAAASNEAAMAIERIKEAEPKAAATLQQLINGFMATFAAAKSVGITTEQNVDLVARMSNAMANANIPAEQLAQEMRSIMTANITADSSLAKILDIDNETVKKVKESGDLYTFLVEQIGQLGEAGDSTSVRMSTLESQIAAVKGQVAEPVFDLWRDSLLKLQTVIEGNPEMVDSLTALTQLLADAVTLTGQVVGAVTGISYGAAVAEAKRLSDAMAEQRDILREQIAAADTLGEQEKTFNSLREVQTKLIKDIQGAEGQRKEILENQLHFVEMQIGSFDKIAGKVRETSDADKKRSEELEKQVELTEQQLEKIEQLSEKIKGAALKELDPAKQVEALKADMLELQSQIRDTFANQDISLVSGLDDTSEKMLALAETVEGPVKLALVEQIAKLSELEGSYNNATDAVQKLKDKKADEEAKKAAEAERDAAKATKERTAALKELADQITEKADAELKSLQATRTSLESKGGVLTSGERQELLDANTRIMELEDAKAAALKVSPTKPKDLTLDQQIKEFQKQQQNLQSLQPGTAPATTTPTVPGVIPPVVAPTVGPATTPTSGPATAPTTTTPAPTDATAAVNQLGSTISEGLLVFADGITTLGQELGTKFTEGSTKIAEVAAAIPAQFDGVVSGISELGKAVTEGNTKVVEGFTKLQTTVTEGLDALVAAVTTADADLARRIATLEFQITQRR